MSDRKAYKAQYYRDHKPSDEARRALSLEDVEKRRKKQTAYRDKLKPPSEKLLKRRAVRQAYRAARATI
jgi:hypothetical protein